MYHFAPDFIQTSYEPEDWAGLRKFVEASSLANRDAILALIDGNREPDNKEWVIKSEYADDYKVMYKECYPGLRRSDYKVEYTIRSYTDVEEIKRVFAESPQKLSLEEFYVLAREYDDNTHELNDVFETAVRMYPNDPVANLNAAISEMQNGDITSAKRHLDKAGDSAEAVYARGIYAAMVKDYDKALELLDKAQKMGIKEAADAITQVNEIK
jgi:tetratricopeptide (TPR) repeat protein